jgi:signal transduction histidine kinase
MERLGCHVFASEQSEGGPVVTGRPRQRQRPRQRRWLRDRRIRTKLGVILALPVLVIVALTGLSIVSASGRAADAGQARELVAVGGTAARLTAQLQHERASAALVFAEASSPTSLADYARQGAATDALITEFQTALARTRLPDNLAPLMARVGSDLAGLASLRQKVATAPDAVLSVVTFRYRAVVADLISYRQALGQGGVSSSTANGLRSAAALSQAIESLSQLQVAAVRALAAGRLTPAGQQEIVAADTGATEALQTFTDLGPPNWSALLNSRIGGGPQVLLAERLQSVVTRSQPGTALDLGTDARGWSTAVGARIDLMHTVEADLDNDMLAAVTAERDAERQTIFTSLSVVAALLLIVVVVGLWVARSLTGSLTRLQVGALDVAERRLPQMVRELDVDSAHPATIERLMAVAAAPIPEDGADEVGSVAKAFNSITASAVHLAGEQAALRAGVGAILVSLSRRLQLRADSMMVSLDGFERDEQDPDRLKKLFDLDHIATLIRRLIFNLQILAGGRGGRARDAAVPLLDLLRAAGQEIDDYRRIQPVDVDDSVDVVGEAADELIHLLAELLDNAARYSPPSTAVVVEARCVGDQLHVQIRDEGTGMAEAELRVARDRVANPRRLDHRATQHMGLPVAGAIAQRLGIKIEFRSDLHRGTVVDLTVPGGLFSRHTAMHEPTAELQPISGAVRAAPPQTWPPIPAVSPDTTTELVIYDELLRDPTRSWFHPSTSGRGGSPAGPERELVGVSAGWQVAARAADAAGSAVPTETTPRGLPVRDPGRRLIPPAEPVTRPAAPVQRHPERLRRQMSAFQDGLGQAGRRQAYHLAKDN